MTRLSVNVNKVAVLRNARGGAVPSVERAARVAIEAGAQGITVHPRPDRRHVWAEDVEALARWLPVELNIEGNPFAPPRAGYPGLLALIERTRPAQATLVPDSDAQLTSDHGFDLARDATRLAPLTEAIAALGCRVSLFVDPGTTALDVARAIGADRIEIYTGPYAAAHAAGRPAAALAACLATATAAQRAGLGVNAGHDLDLDNLTPFLRAVPGVLEVSIGHALIGEALFDGLATTVRRFRNAIAAAADDGISR